jgi:PAS domain S-box-containing protein
LKNQDKLVKSYFENAYVLMIAISSDEILIDMNEAAARLLGYSREEAKGKNWFDMFVPNAKREETKHLFHEMLNGSLRHVHSEHSVLTKQGEERTLNFHNLLVSDEKGKTIGVLSSGDDVTNRKIAEEKSKKIENKLQISLDDMFEGCQIIDYDWRYAYVNKAAAKQGRRTKEQLLGRTMMEMYPGIERTKMFGHLQDCMTNRLPHQMENEFTFPDGSKGWFELHIEPVPEGVLILSLDITKRKELDEELNKYRYRLEHVVAQRTAECAQANEELTRKIQEVQKTEQALKLTTAILDKSKEAIFLASKKGDFLYANESASKVYGYNLDEFLNMNMRLLLQPKDASSLEMLLRHTTEKGQATLEMVHVRKNGARIHVKVFSNVVQTEHGQFIVFVIRRLNYR